MAKAQCQRAERKGHLVVRASLASCRAEPRRDSPLTNVLPYGTRLLPRPRDSGSEFYFDNNCQGYVHIDEVETPDRYDFCNYPRIPEWRARYRQKYHETRPAPDDLEIVREVRNFEYLIAGGNQAHYRYGWGKVDTSYDADLEGEYAIVPGGWRVTVRPMRAGGSYVDGYSPYPVDHDQVVTFRLQYVAEYGVFIHEAGARRLKANAHTIDMSRCEARYTRTYVGPFESVRPEKAPPQAHMSLDAEPFFCVAEPWRHED